MIRRLIRDASLGRKVRGAFPGIVERERIVGIAPVAIFDWKNGTGSYEVIVKRKGKGDGRS